MPEKIGLFHFGDDDKKMPDRSLEKSMEEAGGKPRLRHSIIVLPEAFNIGVKYEGNGAPYDFDPDIECRLRAIAARFECALVAGLIINTSGKGRLPNSAAYFISATCSKVLSLKTGADQMAEVVYEPSAEVRDSPVALDRTTVSALLCMDATERPTLQGPSNRERHAALRKTISDSPGSCPILCIPANTRYFSTIGIAQEWNDFHFVLANGCCLPEVGPQSAGYHPSVIRVRGKAPKPFQAGRNKVIVLPLED